MYLISWFFSIACLLIILIQIFFFKDSELELIILFVATIGFVWNWINVILLKRN